jgi:uncharacterized membrane protein YqaE (UPF0057 family)
MSIGRAILCVIFPPLAVLDKGFGMALLVGILWVFGWVPGIIAAFVINLIDSQPAKRPRRTGFVEIPVRRDSELNDEFEKPKRKGAFVRLADGEIAEVIEDDGAMPDIRKLRDE